MATPKRWSRTVGTRRGNRIRVTSVSRAARCTQPSGTRSTGSTNRPASATAIESAPYAM